MRVVLFSFTTLLVNINIDCIYFVGNGFWNFAGVISERLAKNTIEESILVFQYKIRHRILPTMFSLCLFFCFFICMRRFFQCSLHLCVCSLFRLPAFIVSTFLETLTYK